jgi:hypothetical protein
VALSFDEIAMEVLAWLDDRSFEWGMYVDMPAGAVRYCFRSWLCRNAWGEATQGRLGC